MSSSRLSNFPRLPFKKKGCLDQKAHNNSPNLERFQPLSSLPSTEFCESPKCQWIKSNLNRSRLQDTHKTRRLWTSTRWLWKCLAAIITVMMGIIIAARAHLTWRSSRNWLEPVRDTNGQRNPSTRGCAETWLCRTCFVTGEGFASTSYDLFLKSPFLASSSPSSLFCKGKVVYFRFVLFFMTTLESEYFFFSLF